MVQHALQHRQCHAPVRCRGVHGLSRLVEERMKQRAVTHEEQALQVRQVPLKTGDVHQQAVQSTVYQGVRLTNRSSGSTVRRVARIEVGSSSQTIARQIKSM